jgi:hypothetical protein
MERSERMARDRDVARGTKACLQTERSTSLGEQSFY